MALLNSLKQFNWVDIFFVILLIRICYVAIKNGFSVELFKLLGTVSAIYLSLHYYIIFPDYIVGRIGVKNIPLEYLTFFSFVSLATLGYLIFMLLRKVFSRFIHMEAVSNLNKWGSLILSVIRSFLLISLLIFIFVIAPTDYFRNSVNNSYSGKHLFTIAPTTYTWLWNSVMSKFRTQEKFNDAILKVQASPTEK
jgi:uncharacterized membrane protein required for colicin V production